MITVRAATPADAESIAVVHVNSWRTTYGELLPADYLAGLSVESRATRWHDSLIQLDRPMDVFVALDGEQIVGFISGGPERSGHPLYKSELYAIYLLASYQGQGIGRRLTGALAERLLTRGFITLLLWVLQGNPAVRFYEALGGIRVGEKLIEIGDTTLTEWAYGYDDLRRLIAPRIQGNADL